MRRAEADILRARVGLLLAEPLPPDRVAPRRPAPSPLLPAPGTKTGPHRRRKEVLLSATPARVRLLTPAKCQTVGNKLRPADILLSWRKPVVTHLCLHDHMIIPGWCVDHLRVPIAFRHSSRGATRVLSAHAARTASFILVVLRRALFGTQGGGGKSAGGPASGQERAQDGDEQATESK